MSDRLPLESETQLINLARQLIDPQTARIAVPPQAAQSGYWFGGGNLIENQSGTLYLVGRYRNHGDSRTGLNAGERGLELAIFRSEDQGASFQKVVSLSKRSLNLGTSEVLSIEGSALWIGERGVELFVSTEKSGLGYPKGFESYLKPGTGVWTIDHLIAPTIEELQGATPQPLLASRDPEHLHWKDPAVYRTAEFDLVLMFCTHPYSWTSSNTAFVVRPHGSTEFRAPNLNFFPRGTTWDVAITRGTSLLDLPPLGPFINQRVGLLFYDGGESLRNLEPHAAAVARPRGYSCEELGGLAYFRDGCFYQPERLSRHLPLFVSPQGTRSNRYVDILAAHDGFYATWQQSQDDGSQPLMINFVPYDSLAW